MFDKRSKKIMLAEEICRRGGGYLMLLDSDDLVSNRLAELVKLRHNKRGYFVNEGYVYDAQLRRLARAVEFDRVCGSSVILYLSSEDCRNPQFNWRKYVGDTWHAEFRTKSREIGRPLEPLSFPAVIYVTNNGENHSVGERRASAALRGRAMGVHEFVRDWMSKGRPEVPRAIDDEFGLAYICRGAARYAGTAGSRKR